MTAKDLLKPRFEVIADYPGTTLKVGDILDKQNTKNMCEFYEQYPHLFRKLNWWEHRKIEDMPKKIKHAKYPEIHEVVEWDMEKFIGYFNEKGREGCYLLPYKNHPELGFFPVD